jgi:hypothetical protein
MNFNAVLLEKLKDLVNEEVQIQLSHFAQIVSKRHDISLKLLLQDIQSFQNGTLDTIDLEAPKKSGQCLGLTKTGNQCKFLGKKGGYCTKHVDQKKKVLVPVATVAETPREEVVHVGHTLQEKMFLKGCPACENMKKKSTQNLLIDF